MDSKEIKQKVNEGYIHANVMFEVVGKPKEHVEKSIKSYLEKIRKEEGLEILEESVEEAQEQKDGMFSTVAETELLLQNLDKLTWIVFNFMPASIEIMAPESMTFKARELTNWLNDLLSKDHQIALLSQQVGQQNKALAQNINVLVRNAVLICIDNEIHAAEEFSKRIGIAAKDLQPVLDAMIKENKIKKEDKGYFRT